MSLAIVAERVIGIYCIVIGLAFIIRPSKWLRWVRAIQDNSFETVVFGYLSLIFGAFLVTVHNSWELKPSLITTVFGWAAIGKGFLFFSYPEQLIRFGEYFYKTEKGIRAIGVIIILLGSVIYYYSL